MKIKWVYLLVTGNEQIFVTKKKQAEKRQWTLDINKKALENWANLRASNEKICRWFDTTNIGASLFYRKEHTTKKYLPISVPE